MEQSIPKSPKMDASNLMDTDAETSVEIDAVERLHTRASLATSNVTKSLFDPTFTEFEAEVKNVSSELKKYEAKLDQELGEWKSVLQEAYNNLKKSKQKHPIIDKNILSPMKRKYLDDAPCFNTFVRDSMEFREKAHLFLEVDYDEFMESLENLESLCRHRISLKKETLLTENLRNCRK